MGIFLSLLAKIAVLSLVIVFFCALSWLGVMPLKVVVVFINTLFMGVALFLMADIMLNTRLRQKQKH
jgi:predicted membrane channel-forming protein YqfA (hemolysin III family)